MEAVHPPLFLRFVNLLINDAIFLLDESLANMAKIKEMQTALYVSSIKGRHNFSFKGFQGKWGVEQFRFSGTGPKHVLHAPHWDDGPFR